LIIASVTYVIGQMKGIGVAFGRFLEVDYTDGLLLVCRHRDNEKDIQSPL